QRIEELVAKKRKFLHSYKEQLADVEGLTFNVESDDIYNGVWATSIVFDESHTMKKLDAIKKLAALHIPARPFFYPLSSLPAYKSYHTGSQQKNPNAYDISERGITLPCSYNLKEDHISMICDGIKKILGLC
ncbi:MAG: DegT/DnrJ/EryC1/StrS family aminotransferase, partial [bacterium]